MDDKYQVTYTVSHRSSRWQPMVHREGAMLCVPENISGKDGMYEWDEYRLAPTTHPVPRHIVDAMADAMDMLMHHAVQHMDLDVRDAIGLAAAYPEWDGETPWKVGDRCVYRGALYERRQPWAAPETYPPSSDTASLWVAIVENHAGSQADPIPYSGNLVLEEGKYYTEAGVVYRCIRDSGAPVYNALADLAGNYVEVI